jgi:predicted nucleic acid-binding Zn ribbon protein
MTSEEKAKRRWVKKWEPHRHCLVCGLATSPEKEFCSDKCESEYHGWKGKQKNKNRNTWLCMIGMVVVMVVVMLLLPRLLGG